MCFERGEESEPKVWIISLDNIDYVNASRWTHLRGRQIQKEDKSVENPQNSLFGNELLHRSPTTIRFKKTFSSFAFSSSKFSILLNLTRSRTLKLLGIHTSAHSTVPSMMRPTNSSIAPIVGPSSFKHSRNSFAVFAFSRVGFAPDA